MAMIGWVKILTLSDKHMVYRGMVGSHRIEIETGGFVSFDKQLTNSLHKHDYFELCLVLRGSGEYRHGSNRYRLDPGTVFLAEPDVVHEITSYDSKDLYLFFLLLTLDPITGPFQTQINPIIDSFETKREIVIKNSLWLQNYVPLVENPEPDRQQIAQEALKLFAFEMIQLLAQIKVSEAKVIEDPIQSRALEYIDHNLNRNISVQEIAHHLGVSERTLRRRFEHGSGGLSQEINHRRMRSAAHRLLMGYPVHEVADEIGISSAPQFSRAFQRAFGISPKRFQNSYLPGRMSFRTRSPAESFE